MHTQEYIASLLGRTALLVKAMGKTKWFSFLLVWAILPMLLFVFYRVYGFGIEYWQLEGLSLQVVIPFASIWWGLLTMAQLLNSGTTDVLRLWEKGCALPELILMYILGLLPMIPFYFLLNCFVPQVMPFWLHLLVISFYNMSYVFCIFQLSRSLPLTLLVLLLIPFWGFAMPARAVFPFYLSLWSGRDAALAPPASWPYLVFAFFLIAATYQFAKRMLYK